MNSLIQKHNNRILIIDDNPSIHEDVHSILSKQTSEVEEQIQDSEAFLFDEEKKTSLKADFTIESAYQGKEGLELVENSIQANQPYAMALIDVRMPPGWDGIETARNIWKVCPQLQIIICTAYSDYSWESMIQELKYLDQLVVLKKPFGRVEMLQMVHSMTEKWHLAQQAALKVDQLEKLAEERSSKLNKANAILRAEIEHHKLTETHLEKARKTAQAAIEIRGQFLANMSHELRTPLNAIIGISELITKTDCINKSKEQAEIILESGSSMLHIVNEILDFSKIDSNKLELENIEFDLSLLLDRLHYVLEELTRNKAVTLSMDIDEKIPKAIHGDPNRIRQILLNLASNAIKFTEKGSVKIQCHLQGESEMAHNIHFSISDTGIGIAPETKDKLFEPFTQADSSTTRKFGGTGLGLSICNQLVQKLGGSIEIQSNLGEGSTFSFSIDFPKTDRATLKEETKNSSVSNNSKDSLDKSSKLNLEHILVAEDSVVGQKTIKGQLQALGIEATIVGNGKEALKKAEQEAFDLILMDCQMPEMDGFSATRAIRQIKDPEKASTKVIALTANNYGSIQEDCKAAGMDGHISKPIRLDALLSALQA